MSHDLTLVYFREDGSYIIDNGLYHVPNNEEFSALWEEVDRHVKLHPHVLLPEPPPHVADTTPQELYAQYVTAIQARLDSFAQSRNYDNIMSACTYAASTIPKFRQEGQHCIEMRDATWLACYAILDDVLAGARPMPALNEVLDALPPLIWPEV